jgi:hypothetical protein
MMNVKPFLPFLLPYWHLTRNSRVMALIGDHFKKLIDEILEEVLPPE